MRFSCVKRFQNYRQYFTPANEQQLRILVAHICPASPPLRPFFTHSIAEHWVSTPSTFPIAMNTADQHGVILIVGTDTFIGGRHPLLQIPIGKESFQKHSRSTDYQSEQSTVSVKQESVLPHTTRLGKWSVFSRKPIAVNPACSTKRLANVCYQEYKVSDHLRPMV